MEKARIVAEAMTPGAVVSEVAWRWQLSSQQVSRWRREARAGLLALPAGACCRAAGACLRADPCQAGGVA